MHRADLRIRPCHPQDAHDLAGRCVRHLARRPGTFDEFFDIVSQVKAGELDAKSAILNVGGYFDPLVEMLDRATATGLNSTDWRSNCDVFDSPEPLAAWLEE